MYFLLCVSSPVHVSVHVFFSLPIVSTVCTVHCFHLSRCSRCYVFSLLCVFLFLFLCVCCVCNVFRCSGCCCVLCSHRVQCVCVVIPWRVLVVCCMLLLCVQDVVFVIVCACVQRVKSGAFSHCKKYT